MSNHWVNYLALLAALVVGYGIYVSSGDAPVVTPSGEMLQGYYLRDAVISESSASGAPRFRVAASEVRQNAQDNTVALTQLRVDYLRPDPPNAAQTHWVLNSDAGVARDSYRKLALRGNVEAHNLGAPRSIILTTPELDVDMDAQTATTDARVNIAIDDNVASGRGMFVDMRQEKMELQSDVGIRLAAADKPLSRSRPDISLPEIFEAESWEYDGTDVWTMKKVRSKTPPYIEADTLRATDANERIVLTGAVRLELPQEGWLTADRAVVTVRNEQVTHAHVSADAPQQHVQFQHRRVGSEQVVRGRAREIDYDLEKSLLRLEGDSWFQDAQGEWSAAQVEYNIATGAVRGTTNTIKLNPKSKRDAKP